MLVRDTLSWWFRPRFLRSGRAHSDTLFAGPWVGEFGWELMSWQGFVRKLARDYTRVIVSCRKGNEALYRDFAHEIVPHEIRGTSDCNRMTQLENPEELARVEGLVPRGADWLHPLGHQPLERQEFVRFGSRRVDLETDVVFHPRGRRFGADRNYDEGSWSRLIESLRARGFRLSCVGLSAATVPVQGDFRDLRDRPLEETMDAMASARLVLGPSSGPMHLASLCGTPHLVWADRRSFARGLRSRDKYEWAWNPLGTRALVYDEEGFRPRVEAIVEGVERALGERSTPRSRPRSARPAPHGGAAGVP